jgi:hypothetical protein
MRWMYGFEEIFTRLVNAKTLRSDKLVHVASLVVLLWVGGAALVYALCSSWMGSPYHVDVFFQLVGTH